MTPRAAVSSLDVECWMFCPRMIPRLTSLFGLAALIAIAWAISKNRRCSVKAR